MSDLADRVRAAVAASRSSCAARAARGSEWPAPVHGEAGGATWRVRSGDPERPDWEGGYECFCGDVFVATVAEGGIQAAYLALVAHQEDIAKL